MPGDTVRTTVVLPRELVEALDDLTGPRERSRYIEEALREKIALDRQARAFREAVGVLADEDIPGWETPEAASAWVRKQREQDEERFRRIYGTDTP